MIDSQNSCLSFLNRSIPFFPKEKVVVKPKEQKFMVLEAPFKEEIIGMVRTKLLDIKEQITLTMKIKIIRNRAMFTVTNDTHKTVMFDPTQMLGITELRSLEYYKIKQGVLQQNLSHIYHFESAHEIYDQFNKLINMLRKRGRNAQYRKIPMVR